MGEREGNNTGECKKGNNWWLKDKRQEDMTDEAQGR